MEHQAMTLEIRAITADELTQFIRAEGAAFGGQPDEREIETRRSYIELDRCIAAIEDGRIVGTAGAYSFELTLPGGRVQPVSGVSWVSVLPTYRRRGILRALMRHQLDSLREHGEVMAALTASESAIYRRYGYGPATSTITFSLATRSAQLQDHRVSAGRLRLLDHAQATELLPPLYECIRRLRPGMLSRGAKVWNWMLANPTQPLDGAGPRFYVAYESESGALEGIAHHRIKANWDEGLPDATLVLGELYAVTPVAHHALWSYLLSMDLVATVRAANRPVDEPLRWMLEDPRRMRVSSYKDDLWLRLLDIPAALARRDYAAEGRLVLDVRDSFCSETAGHYEVSTEQNACMCRRTQAAADLVLDVCDLSAAYLGGVRFDTLARAGRIDELTPDAVRRADALFRSSVEPWCATPF
jgi:predicted acetyltransferase